jgi:hypothetical protein
MTKQFDDHGQSANVKSDAPFNFTPESLIRGCEFEPIPWTPPEPPAKPPTPIIGGRRHGPPDTETRSEKVNRLKINRDPPAEPLPAGTLSDYKQELVNSYDDIFKRLRSAQFEILGHALYDLNEIKAAKYPDIDRAGADRLEQRFIKDVEREAFRDVERELFEQHIKQSELPLSIQRPFLNNGPAAAHVYIVNFIYEMIPPVLPISQAKAMAQPAGQRHLGKYLYATIERNDYFYRKLSNNIYLVTGEQKSKRTLQRYLTAYDRTLVFKNFDVGPKQHILAVGYLRPYRTARGAKIFRKQPLTTKQKSETKWRKFKKYLGPVTKKI